MSEGGVGHAWAARPTRWPTACCALPHRLKLVQNLGFRYASALQAVRTSRGKCRSPTLLTTNAAACSSATSIALPDKSGEQRLRAIKLANRLQLSKIRARKPGLACRCDIRLYTSLYVSALHARTPSTGCWFADGVAVHVGHLRRIRVLEATARTERVRKTIQALAAPERPHRA